MIGLAWMFQKMKKSNALFALVIALMLAACSTSQTKPGTVFDSITGELKQASAARSGTGRPDAVDKALLPPLQAELPKAAAAEPRFDLVVNNAPANQVFMAVVSGTRYSMLVHPEVSGTVTVNLKDVTVREALDTIRELYGYEYKLQGARIFIQPLALQSRVFQINYLAGRRQGQTDTRVTSGSISTAQTGATGTTTGATTTAIPTTGTGGSGTGGRTQDSSRIFTSNDADFWTDLGNALRTIVGSEAGRQIILNPMSGVIVVRAFPSDLRAVENFLRATQLVVERQVMIEAKIIEVELKDGFQSGVNWSAFNRGNVRTSVGMLNPGTALQPNGAIGAGSASFSGSLSDNTLTFVNPTLSALPGEALVGGTALGAGVFGLALQTGHFAALLSFLETQGNVQVLSSPRIATINNQKAMLKVGTDEFFVTNISTTTNTTTIGTTSTPSITVQPFFSGIALDVTPQIDGDNNVILHIHPSISTVTDKQKMLDLGTLGKFTLPLASSNVNETDSIVRVQDGNIVAIGGLMKQAQSEDRSGLPGVSDVPVVGALFGQRAKNYLKRELVILLKPTIIQGDRNWQQDLNEVQGRFPQYDPRPPAQ
jgi:MSHA biogenesis protein MshL